MPHGTGNNHAEHPLLEVSWVVISGVISKITMVLTILRHLELSPDHTHAPKPKQRQKELRKKGMAVASTPKSPDIWKKVQQALDLRDNLGSCSLSLRLQP